MVALLDPWRLPIDHGLDALALVLLDALIERAEDVGILGLEHRPDDAGEDQALVRPVFDVD